MILLIISRSNCRNSNWCQLKVWIALTMAEANVCYGLLAFVVLCQCAAAQWPQVTLPHGGQLRGITTTSQKTRLDIFLGKWFSVAETCILCLIHILLTMLLPLMAQMPSNSCVICYLGKHFHMLDFSSTMYRNKQAALLWHFYVFAQFLLQLRVFYVANLFRIGVRIDSLCH